MNSLDLPRGWQVIALAVAAWLAGAGLYVAIGLVIKAVVG